MVSVARYFSRAQPNQNPNFVATINVLISHQALTNTPYFQPVSHWSGQVDEFTCRMLAPTFSKSRVLGNKFNILSGLDWMGWGLSSFPELDFKLERFVKSGSTTERLDKWFTRNSKCTASFNSGPKFSTF